MVHYILVCIVPGDYRVVGIIGFVKEFFVSDFWFLRVLFIYYLIIWVYNLLFNLLHMKSQKLQFLSLVSGSVWILLMTRIRLISGSLSVWYYVWFLAGLFFFKAKSFYGLNLKKVSKCILFVGCTIILFGAFILDAPSKILTIFLVAEVDIAVSLSASLIPVEVRRYLIHIGKNTLPIYAIHWCILFSPIFRFEGYQNLRNVLPLYANALIITVLWMIVCELMIRIMMKSRIMSRVFLGMR